MMFGSKRCKDSCMCFYLGIEMFETSVATNRASGWTMVPLGLCSFVLLETFLRIIVNPVSHYLKNKFLIIDSVLTLAAFSAEVMFQVHVIDILAISGPILTLRLYEIGQNLCRFRFCRARRKPRVLGAIGFGGEDEAHLTTKGSVKTAFAEIVEMLDAYQHEHEYLTRRQRKQVDKIIKLLVFTPNIYEPKVGTNSDDQPYRFLGAHANSLPPQYQIPSERAHLLPQVLQIVEKLHMSKLTSCLTTWDFDAFEFHNQANGHGLLQLSIAIFRQQRFAKALGLHLTCESSRAIHM